MIPPRLALHLTSAALAATAACRTAPAPELTTIVEAPPELRPALLTLPDALTDASREFSALAGWPDHGVIMVPQYPDRFDNQLWLIPQEQLQAVQNGNLSVEPRPLPVNGMEHATGLAGYEGLEALAFGPDGSVAVLVEHRDDHRTIATLLQGTITPAALTLGTACTVTLEPPVNADNQSFEALVWDPRGARWVAMPELNGPPLVQAPRFTAIDPHTCQTSAIHPPAVPWRITDVCATDSATADQLTTINYFWDGDEDLTVQVDPLANIRALGASHQRAAHRERLIEWTRDDSEGSGVAGWRPSAAHWLELGPRARNWEGIACLSTGWLLVTDRHPGSLLAYVSRSGRP